MFKNITEAIDWIINQRNPKQNLIKFKEICNKLNNPQNDFYMIHVAGTNGKGSTVTFLRDILMNLGYKVGTFTSPHYVKHQDRIRVNNINITDEAFLRILNNNYDFYVANQLNMFEMDYLIMCEYFKEEGVDFAIVEVGLGGRLDYTNVVDNPKLEVITTIGYDHMEKLGDTLEKICFEKCGIIKNNSKVLVGNLDDNLKKIVKEEALKKNTKYYEINCYLDLGNRKFLYQNEEYELKTFAKYQIHNGALALEAFKIIASDLKLNFDLSKVKEALKNSIWPCRFEIVKEKPCVILDGAHNIQGINALVKSFDEFKGSKCIIFSALKRKEYHKMLKELEKHTDELIITNFDNSEVIDLKEFVSGEYHINEFYQNAILEAMNKYDNVLICGSLYFLSEVVLNVNFN